MRVGVSATQILHLAFYLRNEKSLRSLARYCQLLLNLTSAERLESYWTLLVLPSAANIEPGTENANLIWPRELGLYRLQYIAKNMLPPLCGNLSNVRPS